MEKILIQICMACLGSVGFAIYFNVEKTRLIPAALGGLVSWSVYLICFHITANLFIANFVAVIIVCILSEILARRLKAPANIFLIPSIIPLVPGGSLYYTMAAAISGDAVLFEAKAMETMYSVLGITMGVVIGFFIFSTAMGCWRNRNSTYHLKEREEYQKSILRK
ncbi:MAG: threonine/serine exporter family protein [Angelakisella sp.]|nr:threonine/serine exporter family protein [Angelakisella sp.]